ncbi:hypothetical protein BDV96DRAFT_15692 [Lophiotrema nucula]|uniref:Uncharacterized protein n=1 Tax=Lophiotrema nucula TaxID=690887 RepID=A0A6A5ZXX3_9PLEO|nr:hypothetical protein BDV96DRAFT_15692 [Lophiotrema nucula]
MDKSTLGHCNGLTMREVCPVPILPASLFTNVNSEFADYRVSPCHPHDQDIGEVSPALPSSLSYQNSTITYNVPISLQECLDAVGSPDHDIITLFVAKAEHNSVLESYRVYAEEELESSQILTWETAFGPDWLLEHSSTLELGYSWIPEARSYYALASRASGVARVLMPFRRQPQDPYQDGRASPWSSYVFPTLTRNPSVSSIVVIDFKNFARTRVIWRHGDGPFGRVPYVGGHDLEANTSSPHFLTELFDKKQAIPSVPHPTVFWSSLCEDTEACLNSSEAIVNTFIATHLNGTGVHWFNLASYWGIDARTLPSKQLSDYLAIAPDSPCYHDPGNTAVLEADTAQGVVFVVLPQSADLARPNEGVKKTCWWCDCELPILTRNLKVLKIVRVDAEDLEKHETVWRRGDAPIGKSPLR